MTGYKINMTDANDLIGALSKLGLSRRRSLNTEEQAEEHVTAYPTRFSHHVIRFVFPALDLVPDISTVILPEPKNIDYRSQPDALKHQLNQYNSEYCYAMDPNSVQPDIDALSANGHVMMLLRILDALASYEAESIISVVSHFFENQIQFRHQLESFAQGERNVYISDFTEQEWSILLSAPRLWIDLLGDVVFRSSARSYIAAEVTILAQDIVFYSRDFEKWRHRWNSANKNAGVRLSMRGQEIEVITTHDPDTRRAYHLIRLSCGHEIHTTAEEMQALMDDNSRISRLRCADCNDQSAWESLEAKKESDELQVISTRALLGILMAAVRSFEVPDDIMPALTQPAHFEETSKALDFMESYFRESWLLCQR